MGTTDGRLDRAKDVRYGLLACFPIDLYGIAGKIAENVITLSLSVKVRLSENLK